MLQNYWKQTKKKKKTPDQWDTAYCTRRDVSMSVLDCMVDGLEPWHGECTCCVSFLMKPSKTHRHFFVLGCFFPLRFTLLGVLKSLVEMKSGVFFYFYFLLFIFSLAYGFRTMKT